MSKMSELDSLVKELKTCGETLVGIAEALRDMCSANEKTEAPVVKETEAPAEKTKEYSFIEVRAVLTEKSRAGKTAEVKSLLRKHGVEKLSDVKPEEYAALVAEAEEL